jgi:hypothetical protein
MQYTTVALASAILLFGLYTLVVSVRVPNDLIKLKYMKSKFGEKAGFTVHTIVYVVVPFIFGYFMLMAGLNGETITQFITEK